MKNVNKEKYLKRRDFLSGFGMAGMGMLLNCDKTGKAEMGRVLSSKFNYKFRTYNHNEVIKVGMIGTDGHTGTIINDLPGLNNVKLTAWSNYGKRNYNIYKAIKLYEGYEEMLDKEELDIVGVCLPYYLNARASIAAAKRGIHIITEKPAATTIEDLMVLYETVVLNKVRLSAMLSMRLNPAYQAVHKAIAEGNIGEPIIATAQKSYKFGKSRPDFYKKEETYGGTIPWIGIHAIDFIHFTTNLNYTEVLASQGNYNHPDYPGFQDYAGVLLRMSNGGVAMVNLDYLRPETAPTHGDDRLRVIGSDGVLEIKDSGKRVELISSAAEPINIPLPERKSFLADFIAELRGEGKHVLSPEEPFEMTRVALLAYQSAKRNSIIKL